MSTALTARGLSLLFANGRELFSNLHFSLDTKLSALVGPNGVGKTCLAKLCAGELEPTSGSIHRNGAVKLFAQRDEPPSITVAEYLAEGYEWSLVGERLLQNIEVEMTCVSLSGGQWMRVRLARMLNDGFLILDEPTNDLDRDGRQAVMEFLVKHRGGALLISHDRECLALCASIFELSNRGLAKFNGDWASYHDAREAERQRLRAAVTRAKRERDALRAERVTNIMRQEKRNQRGAAAAARGGVPKILLGARKRRAQISSGKLDVATLERSSVASDATRATVAELKFDPVMYADLVSHELPAQKLVAEASGFNIRRQDWLYRQDLDFSWRGNIRVALQGSNGSGKSTLLKALLGTALETRGQLRRDELLTLYLDQQCSSLDEQKNLFENIRAVSSAPDSEIRSGLARFLFSKESVFQNVTELSGGERLRAALARSLLGTHQPELIMLDEPTNNLDLINIEFLENIMRSFRGALIVVSHDQAFLQHCGITQTLELHT